MEKIEGRQIKFEMYVNMAQTEISNAYEVLKEDFDNYTGTNSYQPGSGGYDTYSEAGAKGKTEMYRLTWASSYYSYLEQQGLEKAEAPVWDKQLWDSDPNNDGKSDYFSMSLYDVGKVGASIALSLTGAGAVVAAAVNAGISMVHDTANLAVGAMTLDEYGMSMLRSGINGVTGMLTGGIGGSDVGSAILSSSISAAGNLATSGLKMNKEGKLDWYMSGSEWSSWGLGSIASVGAAGLNGLGVGKAVGGWTANAMGGGNTGWGSVMGMGVQKATEGFISSSLSSLAQSYDWSTGQWSAYDWKNVAQGTFTGLASGAVSGAVGYMMGGSYADGGMNFNDRFSSMAAKQNVSLYYSKQLNQIGNTFGSLAGEAMSMAFDGQFTVNLGDGVGIGFGSRGVVRDDYGGVSLGEMLVSARDWKYADFQMKNNWSAAGQSTISYVNLAGMSGLGFGKATAEDIISGKKKLVYSDALDASAGSYGEADRQNQTIMLSKDAILSESDSSLGSKLAWYTSTMAHEGLHLYQNTAGMSGEDLERQAYYGGTMMLSALDQRLGLTVQGSDYEEMAMRGSYFAMTGDAEGAGLDMSGDALKIATAGGIKKVTVEAYKNTPEGRKNDVTGIARALGISEGAVIKYLLSTGRYKNEDDVWSHLKAGEELYAQDGKILTAAEVAKKDGLGGFLNSVGEFTSGVVNGAVQKGKSAANAVGDFFGGIWNSITGGKKQNSVLYPGTTIKSGSDANVFKGLPSTPEEWNRYTGTWRYYIDQYQQKPDSASDKAFCNLWTGWNASQRGIYLPFDQTASQLISYMQTNNNWSSIPRSESGMLDHQAALDKLNEGYFVVMGYYGANNNEASHLAILKPYGYHFGVQEPMAKVNSQVWGVKVPYVESYNSAGYTAGPPEKGWNGTINTEKRVYWEPVNYHFGTNCPATTEYYYFKGE